MQSTATIAIFAAGKGDAAYLADIVRLAGFSPVLGTKDGAHLAVVTGGGQIPAGTAVPVLKIGGKAGEEGVRVLEGPVKASGLIKILQDILRAGRGLPSRVAIGDCELDTRDNLWLRPGDSPVRLTEKETAILTHLKSAGGKPVSREELLEDVWSYVREVETHTLETHIYRLRQKIEEDPSQPKIIITQGDGYVLLE